MINFTVGPVQSNELVREIGYQQVPYFRTDEFSSVMKENESLMLKFAKASNDSRAVFITGSGTASMEASIINTLSVNDKVLVVNGGSFGQRFVDILTVYEIPYEEIKLEIGQSLTEDILSKYDNKDFTAFLVNVHETSTGVHYDMDLISSFCKRNNLFLIVDAISSFLADEFKMEAWGVDIMITGSQKALACPPGISIILLSPKAVTKVKNSHPKTFYLNLKDALSNQDRGQTPFTPAVGILLQINCRLRQIEKDGGVEKETERIANLAKYFRERITDLPFETITNSPSNAVTSLHPKTASAYDIFTILKNEYGIWICPNGGALKDSIFRVGHIGALTTEDYDTLIKAFIDLQNKKII